MGKPLKILMEFYRKTALPVLHKCNANVLSCARQAENPNFLRHNYHVAHVPLTERVY